jgi:hypothetical protein
MKRNAPQFSHLRLVGLEDADHGFAEFLVVILRCYSAIERYQPRPSLFSSDQHLTKEALDLDADIGQGIKGVWDKWLSRGYGIHEIATVMSMKVWEMTMEYVFQYDKKDDVGEGVKGASSEQKN